MRTTPTPVMTDENYRTFERELLDLLRRNGIGNYNIHLIYFTPEGDARVPFFFAAQEAEEYGVSRVRAGAIIAEQAIGGTLDSLRNVNGLDLAAAAGAAEGMIGDQLQQRQVQRMQARARMQSRAVDS